MTSASFQAALPPPAVPVAEPAPLASPPTAGIDLPALTLPARRLLAVLALLFAVCVAARINGASLAGWDRFMRTDLCIRDAPSGLLLSTPKNIRADEWAVWTPAMLNQARQQPSFPVHNPTLGPGATPLLMSLPARHYTMIFRPQLWGFFALPFDFAFSWYWNAKVFGLFAAIFLLAWVLTDGRFGWSVFAAVAIQFSPFVQWWFSTPAMLPEMLTCWALGLVAAITLFLPGRGGRRPILAAVALVFCGVNFALGCYPAFEVPLLHVGGCVLVGYLWQHGLFSWRGAALLAGSLALTALALVPWLLDCLPILRLEAATVYPGQRHVYGGDMYVGHYFSGLLNLAMTEDHAPRELANVCEAANFFPLWLLPLGLGVVSGVCFARRRGSISWGRWLRARGLKVTLAAYLAGVTVYMFVRLPEWLAKAVLIDRSYGRRCLLGMGVAGVLLVVLGLAVRRDPPEDLPAAGRRPLRRNFWAGAVWSLGVLGLLVGYRFIFPGFLTVWSSFALAAVSTFLGVAYLGGPRWLLPVGWTAIFVTQTILINPPCVGLPELLESPMMNSLANLVRADPTAQWAVYGSVDGTELIKATGARVVNGLRIIPDPGLIRHYDPFGKNWATYNRYAHLCLAPLAVEDGTLVGLTNKVYCDIGIHPARLRGLFPSLRYLVCIHEMPEAGEAGFRLVGSIPNNHLWLYRLAAGAPEPVPAP